MKREVINITFLTPCFCGSADPRKAKLRASSIRGQLRWWYRLIARNRDKEKNEFGGVFGDEALASSVTVRVLREPTGGQSDWYTKIPRQGAQNVTYLWGFFCGRTGRLEREGALPPGSRATIELIYKREPGDELMKAVRTMFSIGGLGFRCTRAAGAISSDRYKLDKNKWSELEKDLREKGFKFLLLKDEFKDWIELANKAADLLKNKFRGRRNGLGISAGRNGSNPNPLGSAEPRQASVLHFRPVEIDEKLRLLLIEAPHIILGDPARRAFPQTGSVLELARDRKLI